MTEIEFTLRGSAGFIRGSFTSLGQDYLDIIRRAVATELKCPGVSLRERHHGWSDATYTTTAFARAFNAYLVRAREGTARLGKRTAELACKSHSRCFTTPLRGPPPP